jgi:hypothetical protein
MIEILDKILMQPARQARLFLTAKKEAVPELARTAAGWDGFFCNDRGAWKANLATAESAWEK